MGRLVRQITCPAKVDVPGGNRPRPPSCSAQHLQRIGQVYTLFGKQKNSYETLFILAIISVQANKRNCPRYHGREERMVLWAVRVCGCINGNSGRDGQIRIQVSNSPKKICLSLEADKTEKERRTMTVPVERHLRRNHCLTFQMLKLVVQYLLMGSSLWKSTSLTEPRCPGNLYMILRLVVSHI